MPEIPNKFAFCPGCGTQLSGATFVKKGDVMPVPGDVSVCIYCGAILEFEEGLFVHEILPEELEALRLTNPEFHKMLTDTRDIIIELSKDEKMFKGRMQQSSMGEGVL